MYHIKNDKRSKKSASLIAEGLIQCLKEKEFSKISITDINKVSFVSRATFYRLFDNTVDVLSYKCDSIFEEVIKEKRKRKFESIDMFIIYFIRKIIKHELLLETIRGEDDIRVKIGHLDLNLLV